MMFGRLASLLTILGVGLYFTGWIYRWAYFGYFQLEVTTLDLPLESFLIVPIQVFLGNLSGEDFATLWRTVRVAIATFLIIYISLKLLEIFSREFSHFINQSRSRLLLQSLKRRWHTITRVLQRVPDLKPINYDKNFVDELIIAGWLLVALFYLGKTQGNLDAIRDSRNETSMLPVVTVIVPENQLPLGRKLNDLWDNRQIGKFRFIGDLDLYKNLLEQDYNDKSKSENQIVWRLLIDRDGQYYIFPSLPQSLPPETRPPVVVIQQSKSGEYVIILSPEPAPERSP